MRNGRALAAGVMTALTLSFLGLLTRAIYEGALVGEVAQATLSMLIMVGFLLVGGAVVLAGQGRVASMASHRCLRCGSTLYSTLRSLDRRRLLTCFTCGHETVAA